MSETLEEQVRNILDSMDNQENQEPETEIPAEDTEGSPPAPDEIQDIYVLIVREREVEEDQAQVVDSTPTVIPQKPSFLPAYAICCFYILLTVSTLAFQVYAILNPPIATVTIIPKSQTVTLFGTLQLGRLLNPITISQSQTVPTTGKGYQSAKQAQGVITFYNGQFQSVTIAAGTILTGASGIQVITDQDASIPAGNPPSYGQVTVSAHAINPGVSGNIPAYEINQACCANAVLAKNTQNFTGGQNERNFQTIAKSDIDTTALPLKTTLAQSISGAFQGQLTPQEQIYLLPCTPNITSDHQPGQEATQVKVTVSETCSAVAYTRGELETKAAALLASQAQQTPGAGYSLFGTVHVSIKDATISNRSKVFLSFSASGTWIYGLSHTAQEQIKHLIAGKTTQEALQLLALLPGVERAKIRFDGFYDDTRLPKNSTYIHITLFIV